MTKIEHANDTFAQQQFAKRIAARLDTSCKDIPRDIQERLRASRMRALEIAQRTTAIQTQIVSQSNGSALLNLGDEGLSWLSRLASLLPLVALIIGLVIIQNVLEDDRAGELAEVDTAMLQDDLPPTAYADPGFLQFLKMPLTPSEAAEKGDASQ
jgi:Protein of unknown function (DUF3619)